MQAWDRRLMSWLSGCATCAWKSFRNLCALAESAMALRAGTRPDLWIEQLNLSDVILPEPGFVESPVQKPAIPDLDISLPHAESRNGPASTDPCPACFSDSKPATCHRRFRPGTVCRADERISHQQCGPLPSEPRYDHCRVSPQLSR